MGIRKRAVLLANGKPPTKASLAKQLSESDLFICADGGANAAARMHLPPDLIIGDLDSIEQDTLKIFSRVPTRRIADQNSTDLDKALAWLIRKGFTDVAIFGATGGRLDHAIGNLSAVAKVQRKIRPVVFDADGEFYPALSMFHAEFPPGTLLSLVPLTVCEGVITKGLKWNLKYETLGLGMREGTSNVVTTGLVEIQVRRGTLFVFRAYVS